MSTYNESTYIVFLDIPEVVTQRIDLIRSRVNLPAVKRWVAHITLKQDADYRDYMQEEIIRRIEDFCYAIVPVTLTLSGVQFRQEADGKSWNVYIGIQEHVRMQKLTRTLSKLLMPLATENEQEYIWEQTDDFYPHISIAHGKDITQGQILLHELAQKDSFTDSIVCTSVTLAQWDVTKWKKVKTFSLKENDYSLLV